MNAAYITDSAPFYEQDNYYIQKATETYSIIKTKFGEDAAQSFVESICNLQAMGCINAVQMLKCIHKYSTKSERKKAFKKYEKWKHNQYYTHLVENEKGELERIECTKYIAHAEQGTQYAP